MNCVYFINCQNEEEVRIKYKALAKTLHPDVGGTHDAFVGMKAEFEYLTSGNTVIYYPIGKTNTNTIREDFLRKATSKYPMTPAEALSPEELNNQKAKNHFDRLRVEDQTFDIVDEVLAKAQKNELKPLWVYQEIAKLYDLSIEHYKYMTWKMGDSVAFANMLFRKYKLSKI